MTPSKLVLLLTAATFAAPLAKAQDAGIDAGTDADTKAPPQMSAAEQEMMQKYMQAATPGPEHQRLAKLAGKWKLQFTSWFAPGAPPQKSEGTAEFKTVLGGRYVQQEVKGDMAG